MFMDTTDIKENLKNHTKRKIIQTFNTTRPQFPSQQTGQKLRSKKIEHENRSYQFHSESFEQ